MHGMNVKKKKISQYSWAGLHKFSKNLETTSKLEVPEG